MQITKGTTMFINDIIWSLYNISENTIHKDGASNSLIGWNEIDIFILISVLIFIFYAIYRIFTMLTSLVYLFLKLIIIAIASLLLYNALLYIIDWELVKNTTIGCFVIRIFNNSKFVKIIKFLIGYRNDIFYLLYKSYQLLTCTDDLHCGEIIGSLKDIFSK